MSIAAPAAFAISGFSGIALILYRLWNLPIGAMTVALNIPVAILCYRLLGRQFFFRSVRCMILSSFFIDYVAPLLPVYTGGRLLAAICTGVMGGIGYALIYIRNSSTGGSDFVVMAVKAVRPYLDLGKIIFATDAAIVVVGGVIFRENSGEDAEGTEEENGGDAGPVTDRTETAEPDTAGQTAGSTTADMAEEGEQL